MYVCFLGTPSTHQPHGSSRNWCLSGMTQRWPLMINQWCVCDIVRSSTFLYLMILKLKVSPTHSSAAWSCNVQNSGTADSHDYPKLTWPLEGAVQERESKEFKKRGKEKKTKHLDKFKPLVSVDSWNHLHAHSWFICKPWIHYKWVSSGLKSLPVVFSTFELWCWRRLLRVPWTARRSNHSILKETSPRISLEGMMLKLKLQYFGHIMGSVNSLEKTLMLGEIGGRRRKGRRRMRCLDGITNLMDVSLVNSGSWWWTERPGVLQFMGSQRVGHDWATNLIWSDCKTQPRTSQCSLFSHSGCLWSKRLVIPEFHSFSSSHATEESPGFLIPKYICIA